MYTTTLSLSLPLPPPPSLTFTTSYSKLVVMETTNDVWNRDLYVSVTPFSLLSWVRVLVANRMATGGKNWVDIFSRYNSVRTTPHSPTLTTHCFSLQGTYNNQWMAVDYSLFTPHQPLKDNLVWIAEQLPGYIQSADVTSYLRNGYTRFLSHTLANSPCD